MFDDLDSTLRAMLEADDAPVEVRAADVTFVTPTRDFAPGGPTLNLFLHDVRENTTLRAERPWPVLRDSGADTLIESALPLWVDCGYLVTAWSTPGGEDRTAQEHRLLAQALLWLSRTTEIDREHAVGSLHGSPHHMPVEVGRVAEGERLSQFWTALGIAPRPAFSLGVTVALVPGVPDLPYPRVRKVRLDRTWPAAPALTGLVLDAETLEPLPGAVTVTIEDNGRQSAAGADGRYAFTGLAFGEYRLLVRAADRPDTRVTVGYGERRQIHNVLVTT